MKTYKTAKAILRNSLKEIEDGFWCKGDLYQIEDCSYDSDNGRFVCTLKERQIGCALGHIATFAGHTYPRSVYITQPDGGEKAVAVSVPAYPADTANGKQASPGLVAARDALFQAIPATTRKKLTNRFHALGEGPIDNRNLDYIVADYNDSDSMGQKRAAAWFRRALELV